MAERAVARAPGRVNLIGEHTDYNDGLCLPLAIDLETRVVATSRPDDTVRIESSQESSWTGTLEDCAPGRVDGWVAYPAGVLWALGEAGRQLPGIDLRIDGRVPLGAGLSSSAALEAAIAVAATALLGETLTDDLRLELIDVCRRAENEVVGAPTGGLDQTAVLLARANEALLIDFGPPRPATRRVPLPLADADLHLLVTDTHVQHSHSSSGYADRRQQCEHAADELGLAALGSLTPDDLATVSERLSGRLSDLLPRVRHVISENQRVRDTCTALERDDWQAVGALLIASHESLRDDFEVSCAELDLAAATAVGAGALGARMTGGGFGGSTVALVRDRDLAAVKAAIADAFADQGLVAPTHHRVTPAEGASVEADRSA